MLALFIWKGEANLLENIYIEGLLNIVQQCRDLKVEKKKLPRQKISLIVIQLWLPSKVDAHLIWFEKIL